MAEPRAVIRFDSRPEVMDGLPKDVVWDRLDGRGGADPMPTRALYLGDE